MKTSKVFLAHIYFVYDFEHDYDYTYPPMGAYWGTAIVYKTTMKGQDVYIDLKI